MVVYEDFTLPNIEWVLTKAYSDEGYMLIQDETGYMYSEAIDPKHMNRTYTESNIKIDNPAEEELSNPELDI